MFSIKELHVFLQKFITHMGNEFICEKYPMTDYDSFYKFVSSRYNLDHLQRYNYIKYVKVKREILSLMNIDNYVDKLQEFNIHFQELSRSTIFPSIDIHRYLFKIYSILNIFDKKRESYNTTINMLQSLIEISESTVKIKLQESIVRIQSYIRFLTEKKTVVKRLIVEFVELELKHNIDHSEIAKALSFRSHLGHRSEKMVEELMNKFLTTQNINSQYHTNINLLKLLKIDCNKRVNGIIKGESDGMIITKNKDNICLVELIIEVKSTIKSTFEDTPKFINLQTYIKNYFENDPDKIITINGLTFSKESFKNIIEKPMEEWTLYICVGDDELSIEKSHFYFFDCLKIVDQSFIQRYYIDKDISIIRDKHQVILANIDRTETLFNEWCKNINIHANSNLYLISI